MKETKDKNKMADSKYYEKLDELQIRVEDSWTRQIRKYLGGFFRAVRAGLEREEECISDKLKMALGYAEKGKKKEAGAMVNHLKDDAEKAGLRILGLERLLGLASDRARKSFVPKD